MPTQLTPHFTLEEMSCHCGCRTSQNITPVLRQLAQYVLEPIRQHFGKPVTVNCAYRCPPHNRAVGGVSDSQHIAGAAADITIPGVTPAEIAKFASTLSQVGGIGVYPKANFCHVDIRIREGGQIARWIG